MRASDLLNTQSQFNRLFSEIESNCESIAKQTNKLTQSEFRSLGAAASLFIVVCSMNGVPEKSAIEL